MYRGMLMDDYNDFQEFIVNTISDVYDVLDHGGNKHGDYMGFMKMQNFKKYNQERILRHLIEYYENKEYLDDETCRCNLVHVICRCLMEMYRDEKEHRGRI